MWIAKDWKDYELLDCGGGGHTDGSGNRAACGAELHFRMRMPARFEMLRMMLLL